MGQMNECVMWVIVVMDLVNLLYLMQFQIEGIEMLDKYKLVWVVLFVLIVDVIVKLEVLWVQGVLLGVLQVVQNGKVLLDWCGGDVDCNIGIVVGVEMQFCFVFFNKMFIVVVILQLVQDGRFSFDDMIGKYLLDYLNKVVVNSVIVCELLLYISGLGDFFGDDFEQYFVFLKMLDDYVQCFVRDVLQFMLGSQDSYFNYGFIVLGCIVEVVLGQLYYVYVEEYILYLVGMIGIGFELEIVSVLQCVVVYMKYDG